MMRTPLLRHSGLLLHISSLPSRFGIGDFGSSAYQFADLLAQSGIDHWQILPLGPTGYGNSPYASRSTFAGNELFIDVEDLKKRGYLRAQVLDEAPNFPTERVDYEKVLTWKLPILKQAAQKFLQRDEHTLEYQAFCKDQHYWLEDYALFMTLFETYNDGRWYSHWPMQYVQRNAKAVTTFAKNHVNEIKVWKVLQYFFQIQWSALRKYVNKLGIKLIGDLPIFVAADSADTWSNIHLFKADDRGNFSAISGVPPDFFSDTGQLWGNPVYNWQACAQEDYRWWIQRMARSLDYTDIIRVDHFRGFEAYWEVPFGAPTAEDGTWVQAPGQELFTAIKQALPDISIIAEDLGVITPEVKRLRDMHNFPGMKICQFGFSLTTSGSLDAHDDFLPHNYPYRCVAYTGTHDNDTTRGWFDSIPRPLQKEVTHYLHSSKRDIVWAMIRAVSASYAQLVVFPVQDVLELDTASRMNTPSTVGSHNWSWRMQPTHVAHFPLRELKTLLSLYGRS